MMHEGRNESVKRGLTHGNSAATSAEVRVSLDRSAVVAVPLTGVVPNSCARRCTDCFVRLVLGLSVDLVT